MTKRTPRIYIEIDSALLNLGIAINDQYLKLKNIPEYEMQILMDFNRHLAEIKVMKFAYSEVKQ